MSHNLEYLTTRPGIFKIIIVMLTLTAYCVVTKISRCMKEDPIRILSYHTGWGCSLSLCTLSKYVFGVITIGIGMEAHYDSAYTEALDVIKRNETLSTLYKDIPGTGLEIYFVVASLVCMVVSFFYLAAMSLISEIEFVTYNRYIDSIFHIVASVLLFVAGFVIIYSGATIESKGCYIFKPKLGPVPMLTYTNPSYRGVLEDLLVEKDFECQLLKEKVVAGIFGLLNGVLYAVTSAIIFKTKEVEE